MNREIKFRAWDGTAMHHEGFHISAPGLVWTWIDYTFTDSKAFHGTVMQYTGRKDRYEKKIFEGDICKTIHDDGLRIDLVVYEDGSFLFKNDSNISIELRGFKSSYIEVIGNIFENKELVKIA